MKAIATMVSLIGLGVSLVFAQEPAPAQRGLFFIRASSEATLHLSDDYTALIETFVARELSIPQGQDIDSGPGLVTFMIFPLLARSMDGQMTIVPFTESSVTFSSGRVVRIRYVNPDLSDAVDHKSKKPGGFYKVDVEFATAVPKTLLGTMTFFLPASLRDVRTIFYRASTDKASKSGSVRLRLAMSSRFRKWTASGVGLKSQCPDDGSIEVMAGKEVAIEFGEPAVQLIQSDVPSGKK